MFKDSGFFRGFGGLGASSSEVQGSGFGFEGASAMTSGYLFCGTFHVNPEVVVFCRELV